jgi:hypothetical protein
LAAEISRVFGGIEAGEGDAGKLGSWESIGDERDALI